MQLCDRNISVLVVTGGWQHRHRRRRGGKRWCPETEPNSSVQ